MAILHSPEPARPLIDLRGQAGNAYVLLGTADDLAKTVGLDNDLREEIKVRMKSSDYTHLVHVFEHYFGQYVDLVLPPAMAQEWDANYSIFRNEDRPSPEVVRKKKPKLK